MHPAPTRSFRIDHDSAVHLAAAGARTLAQRCGLRGAMPERAAVVASELGSNLAKHAAGGILYLQPAPLGGGIEIAAADRGPGMAELERCLRDGYSTTGTLGSGLGAVRRIATDFTIRTERGTGTLACARLLAPGHPAARLDVGTVCLAADGETQCGDTCAVADTGASRTAVVIDALGHGAHAEEVARSGLTAFRRDPSMPLPELLSALHKALRRSRGAAVLLMRVHEGSAEFCGAGNVRCQIVSPDRVTHGPSGPPGIVGWKMPLPKVHRVPLTPGSVAVVHTDGIDPRWPGARRPFLHRLPPPLLALALAHGHRLSRDDATVLTATALRRTHDH
ncbi:SpoIIE family protein phosphatase [Streptomyces sodiiphilus]|uniref:SpoIIE family protein phosphatase n=1 Tax=Streptomyces sodiiphilus TaxID=226217 RepID=A0ABN2P325_9ACTN